MFDTSLPKITEDDIDRLRRDLPDLAEHLNVPDISAITNFFLIKSVIKKDEEKQDGENIVKAVKQDEEEEDEGGKIVEAVSSGNNLESEKAVRALPHLKDLDK